MFTGYGDSKVCTKCKVDQPIDRFRLFTKGYGAGKYRESWCATCKNVYLSAYRKANPKDAAVWRNKSLLHRYGLTTAEYDAMLVAQGGVCAICKKAASVVSDSGFANRYGRLHVDHDHETGRVRGLLCGNCNRGIGMFQHKPVLLQNALSYLHH